jgi:hypothetical protein
LESNDDFEAFISTINIFNYLLFSGYMTL